MLPITNLSTNYSRDEININRDVKTSLLEKGLSNKVKNEKFSLEPPIKEEKGRKCSFKKISLSLAAVVTVTGIGGIGYFLRNDARSVSGEKGAFEVPGTTLPGLIGQHSILQKKMLIQPDPYQVNSATDEPGFTKLDFIDGIEKSEKNSNIFYNWKGQLTEDILKFTSMVRDNQRKHSEMSNDNIYTVIKHIVNKAMGKIQSTDEKPVITLSGEESEALIRGKRNLENIDLGFQKNANPLLIRYQKWLLEVIGNGTSLETIKKVSKLFEKRDYGSGLREIDKYEKSKKSKS